MKLFGNLKTDGIKNFTGYGFYMAVFFTVVLCLSSPVFRDEEKQETYSVVNVLQQFDAASMQQYTELNAFTVAMSGDRGWLSLFVPIIAGFTFVPLMCDEYKAGAVRNAVFRSSNFRYHTAKFVMACFSGGLAVMLGYGIYMCIIWNLFPQMEQYSQELQQVIREETADGYLFFSALGYKGIMVIKLAQTFLYGVISVMPVVFLSSFIKNKYLVLCIPFFIQYGLTQFCSKIRADIWNDMSHAKAWLGRLVTIVLPNTVADLIQYTSDKKYIVMYHFVWLLFLYIGYMLILHRRIDYGE